MASGVMEDNPQGDPTPQTTAAFRYCFDLLECSAAVDRNGASRRSQQDHGADPAVLADAPSPGTTDGGRCRDRAKSERDTHRRRRMTIESAPVHIESRLSVCQRPRANG